MDQPEVVVIDDGLGLLTVVASGRPGNGRRSRAGESPQGERPEPLPQAAVAPPRPQLADETVLGRVGTQLVCVLRNELLKKHRVHLGLLDAVVVLDEATVRLRGTGTHWAE